MSVFYVEKVKEKSPVKLKYAEMQTTIVKSFKIKKYVSKSVLSLHGGA